MSERLQVTLFHGWVDISQQSPGSYATYVRQTSAQSGVLKISYIVDNRPGRPAKNLDIIGGVCEIGQQEEGAVIVETREGTCHFGRWGTAIFRSPTLPRFQLWMVTDGRDTIFITHYCRSIPDPQEVREAQAIVESLSIRRRPWWRFW